MGIRGKILIFIVVVLFIPITFLAFFSYNEARRGLENLAKIMLRSTLKNKVDFVRSKLEFVIRSNPEIIDNDNFLSSLIEDDLHNVRISDGSYFFVINHDGRVLVHPKRDKKFNRENFLQSPYPSLRETAGKMIESEVEIDLFRNEDGFMYVSSMLYNQGEVFTGSSKITPRYELNWSIGFVLPQTVVLGAARKILYIFFVVSAVSFIFSIILGYVLIKLVLLNNIGKLVCGINKLTDDFDNVRLDIKSKDEIGYLAESFNDMVVELKHSRIKLIEQEKLKQEVELASRIQTCLLPEISSSKSYDISAKMLPAENVGGDYYDFISALDDRIWLGIGDVSGHGLTSGLIMMMAQTAFNTILLSNPNISSSDLIVQANRVIYCNIKERMKEDHFMTLSFLSADSNGDVTCAGAHLDIFVYRASTGLVEAFPTNGLWLGLLPEISGKIDELSFKLEKDDVMLLYTDGIIEAMDESRKLYEPERLLDVFQKLGRLDAESIMNGIIDDVLGYLNIQYDDISLVVVKKK